MVKEIKKPSKIKKRIVNTIRIGSAIALISGLGIAGKGFIRQLRLKEPEINKTFNNAISSLYDLEKIKESLINKFPLPYENPQIRNNLNKFCELNKSNVHFLDDAINNLEKDISKIQSSQEFKEYQNKIKSGGYLGFYGVAIFAGSMIPLFITQDRMRAYKLLDKIKEED